MDVLSTPAAMRAWRRIHAGSLGLVPTMGYLHEGHLSLVRRARCENDLVVASIFVNPAQFGPNEDFDRYPRDEVRDLSLLEAAGVDAVYLPAAGEMYPPGYQTFVAVEQVTRVLEGDRRPGHFRGVATIVLKLFNAAGPDRAYFGRKDAQQLRVIRRLAADLDLGLEVVGCEIVREQDGLAMSSRNVYLDPAERAAATVLFRALAAARQEFERGLRDPDRLRCLVRDTLAAEPLAAVDYVSVAEDATLEEFTGPIDRPALLSVAVAFGSTRLLDNVELVPLPG